MGGDLLSGDAADAEIERLMHNPYETPHHLTGNHYLRPLTVPRVVCCVQRSRFGLDRRTI